MTLPMGNAQQKPPKDAFLKEKRLRSRARVAAEQKVMRDAKRRDHHNCRYPGCDCAKLDLPIHACHETHRGMGGNPKLDRTTRDQLISLCGERHREWDTGIIAIVPQDRAIGFDGPADFYRKHPETGRLEMVASEKRIGVSVARS